MPLQEFFLDAYYNCCGAEVWSQLSQSCAQRACSQMEKFPKSAFNDSSAHELSNERGKKKSNLTEGKVNSAYCINPLKTKGCLVENKLNSYPRSRKSYPYRINLNGGNRLFMKQNRETLTHPLQCLL